MKALEILYSMIDNTRKSPLSNKNNYEQLTYIAESIEELEAIENRSCFGCMYSSKTANGSFCLCFSIYTDFEYCSDWKAK